MEITYHLYCLKGGNLYRDSQSQIRENVSMATLYQSIASEFASGIDAGIYKPGERLPGVRATSLDKGVSAATAVAAYRQLEVDGYIEARERSGFFVRARAGLLPEPIWSPFPQKRPQLVKSQQWILDLINDASDTSIVNFGSAVADPDFLPTALLEKVLKKNARLHRREVANYELPMGSLTLREQLVRRMAQIGCMTRVEDIVVTNGCQEAVVIALKLLTRPGDTIALESPTYHGHLQVAESLGLKVLEIPTHPVSGISLPALELALEKWSVKACLVVPNFNNPSGSCMPDKHKRALVKLLAKAAVPLIEDDIYGDLSFDQQRPSTLKALDRSGDNIYCSSFSKSLSPGLRVGWMLPGNHIQQATYQKFITSVATNSIGQMAVADILASGQYQRHLRRMRLQLANANARMRQAISEHFPPGTKITRPQGGYVLWVELPEGSDALWVAARARERGISVAPGPMFSASEKYGHFMRISCAVDWNNRSQRAIREIASLLG